MSKLNLILFDDTRRDNLLPFTFTRPACDIRCGILTVREKWEKKFGVVSSSLTQEYLQKKFPLHIENENLWINGTLLFSNEIAEAVEQLGWNESLAQNGILLAAKLDLAFSQYFSEKEILAKTTVKEFSSAVSKLNNVWDIFQLNEKAIMEDFQLLTKGRLSKKVTETNRVTKHEWIFLEEGVKIENCVLNASKGPIYIGKNTEIMEGSLIRGPFAAGENCEIKMGAKIYGATTLGNFCKVGGEINNCVIFGYSNKAHDGFIGNSVIGEWCNLGADTNTSNLKNDYAEVKLWNYTQQKFESSGTQFCGLMMGDHSKCGINTMFNTGTVVGVSANIFGAGFPRTIIPSFSWGGAAGITDYKIDKAFDVMERVMQRRGLALSEIDKEIFTAISTMKNK